MGYVPAAVAFGAAARQAGLSVQESVAMSLLVYAGASQFALAGMIGAGVPGVAAAVTALVLNLRHVLYGPALAPWLSRLSRPAAALAAFGLTDEVFAVASGILPRTPASGAWLFGLEVAAYGSWVLGTWMGAAGGQAAATLLPSVAPAMNFALPALFVALLVSLVAPRKELGMPASAFVGGAVALAAWLLGRGRWGVLTAGVVGPLAGLAVARLERQRPEPGPSMEAVKPR
ncbi:AzlC family ABC transporter permease [Carboxydochorda subterranea]|uniref:AzlC family ABC transporter permease n=1 Tax=Carboxydichorda subterranea TaxID=3109565 RepID=A0ABZ1BVE6_9FIRM|nr:AzlC family ABC transporter permease [Limnochorda sp. L945t]WRP16563.1 AzlC family ABC transporter permease [Limnochorda sp. L945t]